MNMNGTSKVFSGSAKIDPNYLVYKGAFYITEDDTHFDVIIEE